ncbi:MAG: polysaccharide deacetylase family protein [archaeon]
MRNLKFVLIFVFLLLLIIPLVSSEVIIRIDDVTGKNGFFPYVYVDKYYPTIKAVSDLYEDYNYTLIVGINYPQSIEKYAYLIKENWIVACHGYTHKDLTTLNEADLYYEVCVCKQELDEITGRDITTLIFPYDQYNEEVINLAKSCGYTDFITPEGYDFDDIDLREKSLEELNAKYLESSLENRDYQLYTHANQWWYYLGFKYKNHLDFINGTQVTDWSLIVLIIFYIFVLLIISFFIVKAD